MGLAFMPKSDVKSISTQFKQIKTCVVKPTMTLPRFGKQMYHCTISYDWFKNDNESLIKSESKNFFGTDLEDLKNQIQAHFDKKSKMEQNLTVVTQS